jgi:hypothetical protein
MQMITFTATAADTALARARQLQIGRVTLMHDSDLESASSFDLLGELLDAFGFQDASFRNAQRTIAEKIRSTPQWGPWNPEWSPSECIEAGRSLEEQARLEREQAKPVLRVLVTRLRQWRQTLNITLPHPAQYRQQWQSIIDDWSRAVLDNQWICLTPLCQGCGTPVLCRRATKGTKRRWEASVVCSDDCRATYRQRQYRERHPEHKNRRK